MTRFAGDIQDASNAGNVITVYSESDMQKNVYRIVLTGGPCAGKTTALSQIRDRLLDLGYTVFLVPESATNLFAGGMEFADEPLVELNNQEAICKLQMATEDIYLKLAEVAPRPAIVIFDRGMMDAKAFAKPDVWQAIVDRNSWSTVSLRDRRYDAVIHMVTVAIGAPEFYTKENNVNRRETAEEAALADKRLQDAWLGHPHLRVIDNSTDFEGKIRRTMAAICRVVGVPEPVENERKYLVSNVNLTDEQIAKCEIFQMYLLDGSRIRRRGENGSYTYTHTIKGPSQNGKRVEYERPISPAEWLQMIRLQDPNTTPIMKWRTCFMYRNQYMELDTFVYPFKDLILLEVELDDDDQQVDIPPFITVERDVTEESMYANYEISKAG